MMDKINEFMKRQAEIELEYSKAIQKLVKQQKDDILKKSQEKAAFKSG